MGSLKIILFVSISLCALVALLTALLGERKNKNNCDGTRANLNLVNTATGLRLANFTDEDMQKAGILWKPKNTQDKFNATTPFHHLPRRTISRLGVESLRELLNPPLCKCPPQSVLVVHINTKREFGTKTLLEETMERCGCMANMHRLRIPKGRNTMMLQTREDDDMSSMDKIEALHSYLSGPVPSGVTHLVYLDSFDGALVGDASDIIERFNEYECEVLVAATNVRGSSRGRRERLRRFQEHVSPRSNSRYPDSGGIMASVGNMSKLVKTLRLDYADKIRCQTGSTIYYNDNVALEMLHFEQYPKIIVDSMNLIFLNREN